MKAPNGVRTVPPLLSTPCIFYAVAPVLILAVGQAEQQRCLGGSSTGCRGSRNRVSERVNILTSFLVLKISV